MRLRTRFILLIASLHLVALVLSFYILKSNGLLFIGAELVILASLYMSWQLYKQMVKPLQTVTDGIEAIKDKDFNVKFLRTGSDEMDRLIDVFNEMMDHLKRERTLQEQQHFFLEKLIQTSPTGILILDFDERVQQANPKACVLLGATEKALLGHSIDSFHKPLLREISGLKSGEGKTVSTDGVHTYKLQRSQFIDRGFSRSFIMMEELTTEILAAEKKAYGKVIRMMAHEVNNTIGPVNSILESALKTKGLWTPETGTLEHALQVAFDRNQNLNIFMRNFADVVRLPLPDKRIINLDEVLDTVVTLFRYKSGEARIQILLLPSPKPFIIEADRQQLEQALINVIKNAIEAIEKEGQIVIGLDRVARVLTITDTGPGISNEHSDQLFSPFFSTKKNGQGVGLTLVKEILLNHGFEFSLRTIDENRTVFTIAFK